MTSILPHLEEDRALRRVARDGDGQHDTCWKLGQRLLPDPVRQILKG